jgi:hypothetical protein
MSTAEPLPPEADIQAVIATLSPQWRWAAERVLSHGWEVFPCNDRVRPDPDWPKDKTDWSKRPRRRCASCKTAMDGGLRGQGCLDQCGHRLCHGLLGASNDIHQVIAWAREFPNANVAARTGIKSNLFVIDSDGPEGEARLRELQGEHSELNDTQRHQTGGGTWHYLHNYPKHRQNKARADGEWRNNSRTLLGEGLDTRGEGGYILLPGSCSRKGPYKAEGTKPQADVNDWVLDLLETPKRTEISPERKRELAANPRFDPSNAPGGVHPYVAAMLVNVVEEFRSLTSTGSGRTSMLTGGAMRLSSYANATPPSGLTEDMVREEFVKACHANGYAQAHSDWEYQLDRGLADGRGRQPSNWPLPEPVSDTDRLITEAVDRDDPDEMESLSLALGLPVEALRARYGRSGTVPGSGGGVGGARAGCRTGRRPVRHLELCRHS